MIARPPALVSPNWLAENLEDQSLRILDATIWFELNAEGGPPSLTSGRAAWERGHIPGAEFADLFELSDPNSPLPFMLPTAEHFAACMSKLGVGPGTHVIAYDAAGSTWAARLWWMLRVFGFDAVSVLDGGWTAWRDAGLPTSTDSSGRAPARFEASFRPGLVATREQVLSNTKSGAACLINALEPPVFRGDIAVVPGRGGRIPGSVSVPANELIDPRTKRLKPLDRLRQQFGDVGALGDRPVVAYCGAAIAATLDAFVLSLLGRKDVAVYDGSLVEWASDQSLPLDRG